MNNTISKFQRIRKRRAVSQIIGSLFALAIVAALGSVLVIQGNQGIINFTSFLDIFEDFQIKPAQEILIIEHARLDPKSEQVEIWVRNVGKINVIIDRITMVKIDTQESIIIEPENFSVCDDVKSSTTCTPTTEKNVFQEETRRISFCAADTDGSDCSDVKIPNSSPEHWEDQVQSNPLLNEVEFRLSITTARDSTFETIVEVFNT